jgi:hypothetical protein
MPGSGFLLNGRWCCRLMMSLLILKLLGNFSNPKEIVHSEFTSVGDIKSLPLH